MMFHFIPGIMLLWIHRVCGFRYKMLCKSRIKQIPRRKHYSLYIYMCVCTCTQRVVSCTYISRGKHDLDVADLTGTHQRLSVPNTKIQTLKWASI